MRPSPVRSFRNLSGHGAITWENHSMEHQALSVEAFCQVHAISRSSFYELKREGLAPRVMKIGRRTLISAEAAADWRRAMEKATAAHESGSVR